MFSRLPVKYGYHQIVGTKNEDRGSSDVERPTEDDPLYASFGVYDGHSGSMGSSAIAQYLPGLVKERFKAMSTHSLVTSDNNYELLKPHEKLDACFCEAMRITCQEMNESIQASDTAGSVMESLFCLYQPEDGSTRLYFSKIGDSRSVLFGSHFSAVVTTSIDISTHSENALLISDFQDDFETGPNNLNDALSVRSRAAKMLTKAFAVGEDHVLTLQREKQRIVDIENRDNMRLYWHALPASVFCEIKRNNPHYQSTMFTTPPESDDIFPSLFDVGYPLSDKQQAAAELIKELHSDPAIQDILAMNITIYQSTSDHSGAETLDESHEGFPLQHEQSFINRRDPSVAKEAVFGQYNLSAMMTRTIGDKYGPHCCIPLPDISAITIKKDEFARVVMASDGMWDVVNVESVRRMVMKFESPEEVAIALAQSASNIRAAHGARKDDITVYVVDINPQVYEENYSTGRCTIV